MPTIITHAALPLIAAWGVGKRIPAGLALAGAGAAMLPDADVVGFLLGIPYDAPLGHRGASHSFIFAVLLGLTAAALGARLGTSRAYSFAFVTLATLSHGLTDMLTDGGRGIALAWPMSDMRFFAPWRPIQVSAIGVRVTGEGGLAQVLVSEFIWLLVPAAIIAVMLRAWRRHDIDLPRGRS